MGQAEEAVQFAHAQLGKPYKFGAVGPDAYDCSGLVVAAYQHANPPIFLPHWTGALIGMGSEVAKGELQPGDLVFPDPRHVQIFAGSGQIIEAQQDGVPVRMGAMWGFWRARRIVGTSGKSVGSAAWEALKSFPGPLSVGASTVDVLRPVGVLATNLSGPNFWKRVGAGVTGSLLVGVGLLWMFRRPIEAVGAATGRAVGSVGSLAVQGAAFGFGAGGSSARIGGGASAPPTVTRFPRPPAPAIAPRTSPIAPRSPIHTKAYVGVAKAPPRPLPGDASTHTRAFSRGGKATGKRLHNP